MTDIRKEGIDLNVFRTWAAHIPKLNFIEGSQVEEDGESGNVVRTSRNSIKKGSKVKFQVKR